MKKLFFSSMLLGGLMMASCSDDVMEAPKQEEVLKTYAQKFTEKFGPIAADQDWNMAEGKSINVNGASRAAGDDLKIYAKYQGVYRLVAHFDDASQATYDFTSPKGVNEFIVTCGGQIQMVENGGAVDFSAMSRTYLPETQNVFDVHDEYTSFEKKSVVSYVSSVNNGNVGNGQLKEFQFYNNGNDGSVTVYPIYWDGKDKNEYHVFGIYYYENDAKVYVPIYKSKVGEDLKYNGEVMDNTNIWKVTDSNKKYEIESRGFDVTLKNKPFGFYVEVYEGADYKYTWHSVSEDDEVINGESHIQLFDRGGQNLNVDGRRAKMMAVETQLYPEGNTSKWDDLFFVVDIKEPTSITTEEPQAYILAVEDLGIQDDYDFNDAVFSISYVTGKTEAKVKALAAGGTLPLTISRGDEDLNGGKEFHAWFGAASNKMINTTSGQWVEGEEVTITVPADFKMQSNAPETMMGGFKVHVTKDGGKQTSIAAPGMGAAPQMICVPADWMWMEERSEIDLAYPMFGEYGEGYATTDWLNDLNINVGYLYDANNAK